VIFVLAVVKVAKRDVTAVRSLALKQLSSREEKYFITDQITVDQIVGKTSFFFA